LPLLRVTIRHYYDFGTDRAIVGDDLVRPDAWDRLRTKTSGVFAIPPTREEFVQTAEGRADIAGRARAIDAWLEGRGARVVASYGVGGAALEWWLHKLRPRRKLIVTDYGEATVQRLVETFPEVVVRYHDMHRDEQPVAEVHLFQRIDTALTNRAWKEVFTRFARVPILVVATEVLDLRRLLLELRLRRRMKLRHATKAGYIRSSAAFEALWRPTHTSHPIRMHDLSSWELRPRAVGRTDSARGLSHTYEPLPERRVRTRAAEPSDVIDHLRKGDRTVGGLSRHHEGGLQRPDP